MKSFIATLILCVLMLLGVIGNALYVNTLSNDLLDRLKQIPDVGDPLCVSSVNDFCALWDAHSDWIELSAGFPASDRITEYSLTLLACAEAKDLYGYRTALALLIDSIEDLRRHEQLSIGNLL